MHININVTLDDLMFRRFVDSENYQLSHCEQELEYLGKTAQAYGIQTLDGCPKRLLAYPNPVTGCIPNLAQQV